MTSNHLNWLWTCVAVVDLGAAILIICAGSRLLVLAGMQLRTAQSLHETASKMAAYTSPPLYSVGEMIRDAEEYEQRKN